MNYQHNPNDNRKGNIALILALILYLIIALAMSSCDVLKTKTSNATDTTAKENIETKTFRKGDTVTFIVPKVTLKDTTIYTYNRQGTTLKTVYNKEGNITSVDCFASAIEEIKKENREFQQNILEQTKDKKSEVNSQWIWAVAVGVCFVFLIIIIAIFLYFKSIIPKI